MSITQVFMYSFVVILIGTGTGIEFNLYIVIIYHLRNILTLMEVYLL